MDEAVQAVADLFPRGVSLSDSEDTDAKTENSTAAVKWESSGSFCFSDHGFFPMAMW